EIQSPLGDGNYYSTSSQALLYPWVRGERQHGTLEAGQKFLVFRPAATEGLNASRVPCVR
ncbi:hypothetical protein, partial [Fusicatenibacter faecihominis]|uniref:hypothetical protein n=1 Tax=Fusicatenibacter faecihominis TaxID=2881276 RepID=UPI0032C1A790